MPQRESEWLLGRNELAACSSIVVSAVACLGFVRLISLDFVTKRVITVRRVLASYPVRRIVMLALKHLPNLDIDLPSVGEIKPLVERYVLLSAAVVVGLVMIWAGLHAVFSRSDVAAGMMCVKVHAGESLWTYAKKYGDPDVYILKRVQDIAKINRIDAKNPLQPGQELIVPVEEKTLTAEAVATMSPWKFIRW